MAVRREFIDLPGRLCLVSVGQLRPVTNVGLPVPTGVMQEWEVLFAEWEVLFAGYK